MHVRGEQVAIRVNVLVLLLLAWVGANAQVTPFMPAHTTVCNNTASSASPKNCTIAQMATLLSSSPQPLTTTTLIVQSAVVSEGTTFTIASGCATVSALTGGATEGSFATTATTCTPVITFVYSAPNGWVCDAKDITTPVVFTQTGSTMTTCTVSGTTTSGDTVVFDAFAF